MTKLLTHIPRHAPYNPQVGIRSPVIRTFSKAPTQVVTNRFFVFIAAVDIVPKNEFKELKKTATINSGINIQEEKKPFCKTTVAIGFAINISKDADKDKPANTNLKTIS